MIFISVIPFQAKARKVEAFRDEMFCGSKINFTEDRAVLHIALRHKCDAPIFVDGINVVPKVKAVLQHIKEFTDEVNELSSLADVLNSLIFIFRYGSFQIFFHVEQNMTLIDYPWPNM